MQLIDIIIGAGISIVILLFSAIIHECAHGWVAYKMGDNTAYYAGRITLNPIKHIDPFMTIILPLVLLISSHGTFAFGGAKPVPINPYNFRNPDKGMMLSSIAGPVSNFLLAIIGFGIFMIVASFFKPALDYLSIILWPLIYINVMLAVFNLIPIPPLDGSRILRYFLPWDMKQSLDNIEPFGFVIIMILLFVGGFGFINIIIRDLFLLLNSFVR